MKLNSQFPHRDKIKWISLFIMCVVCERERMINIAQVLCNIRNLLWIELIGPYHKRTAQQKYIFNSFLAPELLFAFCWLFVFRYFARGSFRNHVDEAQQVTGDNFPAKLSTRMSISLPSIKHVLRELSPTSSYSGCNLNIFRRENVN